MRFIYINILTLLLCTINSYAQNISFKNDYENLKSLHENEMIMLPGLPSSTDYFFKKHFNYIDFSIGGGNYGVSSNNSINKTGTGGQNLLSLNYEFAFSHKFGLGALLELGGLVNPDLNTRFNSGVFGLKVYYHFYNSEKSSIYTSLALCKASASSKNENLKISEMKGSGNNVQLSIGVKRQIFKPWLGFNANLAFVNYTFDKWLDGTSQIKNNLGAENLLINIGGYNFTTGLSFRF